MLVGAATTPPDEATFEAVDAQAGPFTVRRSYDTGIPVSWAASAAGVDVGRRASVWSVHPDIGAFLGGGMDAALKALVRSIPDEHLVFITGWHEADAKVRRGEYTAAQYRQAFARLAGIVHGVGKPRVYVTSILTTYTFNHLTPGCTPDDMWPGDGVVDVLAVDGYGQSQRYDPVTIFETARQFAKSKGVAWGIAETGAQEDPSDPTALATWMHAVADYAATHSAGRHSCAAFLCWFDSDVGGSNPTPSSSPQALAAAREISHQHRIDYHRFVL